MNELKKIYGKKTLLICAAAVLINFILFMLSCDGVKDITASGSDLSAYIVSYPKFIKNTIAQSENMALLNVYESGFAEKNIAKTAADYAGLSGLELKYGDNRAAAVLAEYRLTDIFLAAFMMIISAGLLSERKKGLAALVRSTAGGRGRLYISRIGAILVSSFCAAVLLYGGNAAGAYISFGDVGLSRAVQSVPEFMLCPYQISIGGFLLLSAAVKAFAAAAAASVFFLLISLLGTAGAYAAGGLFTVAEVLLYILTAPVSGLNFLRYINIFALISSSDYFTVYCNLNIFGNPVPILSAALVFCAVLFAAASAAGYFVHKNMYVKNEYAADAVIRKIKKAAERRPAVRPLFAWEGYKLLIKRGGVVILAAVFCAAFYQAVRYEYFYPVNPYEFEWYEKYKGEITAENMEKCDKEQARLEATIERLQTRLDEMLAKGDYDPNAYGTLLSMLEETKKRLNGLLPVSENIRSGVSYTERTGNAVMLIKPYSYELLFTRDGKTVRRAALYILIGIIAAVSGVYSYERQCGMTGTIRSAYRGRLGVTVHKTVWTVLICALLCFAVHFIQIIQVNKAMGLADLSVPVQSLMFMRDFEPYITILEYIALLFAVRMISACVLGLICLLISRFCSDTAVSAGVCGAFAAVSSLLPGITGGGEFFSILNWIGCGSL